MTSVPRPDTHPNTFGWYNIVSRFTPEVRGTWAGAAAAPSGGKQDGGKQGKGGKGGKGGKQAKVEEKKEEAEELDLFGEEDEADVEAKKNLKAKAGEVGKKKKAPPVAKSIVIWEVKPWGLEVDLDVLGKKIIDEIQMDGLTWKTEF